MEWAVKHVVKEEVKSFSSALGLDAKKKPKKDQVKIDKQREKEDARRSERQKERHAASEARRAEIKRKYNVLDDGTVPSSLPPGSRPPSKQEKTKCCVVC